MKKANKQRNPVAKQLRHFKNKVIKNKRKIKKQKFKVVAEIVNGKCPTCDQFTMLVGIEQSFFRCMSCGSDLEQHVNGCIRYIPRLHKTTLQSVVDGYFNGEEV